MCCFSLRCSRWTRPSRWPRHRRTPWRWPAWRDRTYVHRDNSGTCCLMLAALAIWLPKLDLCYILCIVIRCVKLCIVDMDACWRYRQIFNRFIQLKYQTYHLNTYRSTSFYAITRLCQNNFILERCFQHFRYKNVINCTYPVLLRSAMLLPLSHSWKGWKRR